LTWKAQTLGEVLAARTGEALVTQSGRFSYGELLDMAKQKAAALQALGIRHGERVGILMGNDEHWL
jgi:non-ribosomal peptide synthetase component E (peptide arylation enzyme)